MPLLAGIGYSVIAPPGVILPILLVASSTNHILPSGPGARPRGPEPAVGIGYSAIAPVCALYLPMLLARFSENQMEPSAPTPVLYGQALAVGSGISVIVPSGVILPILLPWLSAK